MGRQAADTAKAQEALFVDMGNDKADGIHVGGKHDLLAAPLLMADQVSKGICGNLIYKGGRQLFDGLGHLALVTRGPVTGVQRLHCR